MPTPERTSTDEIVAAGREILEVAGPSGLTMQAVANRVGVRAPSLYKRVRDRDALHAAVATASIDALTARLEAAGDDIGALAHAYRDFAHAHPEGFRIMFTIAAPHDALERSAAPLMRAAASWSVTTTRSTPPVCSPPGRPASCRWSCPERSDSAVTSTALSSTACVDSSPGWAAESSRVRSPSRTASASGLAHRGPPGYFIVSRMPTRSSNVVRGFRMAKRVFGRPAWELGTTNARCESSRAADHRS